MQPVASSAVGASKLVETVMVSTSLTEGEVQAAVGWVDEAMLRSRFNIYHDLGNVIKHIRLAVSVPPEDLDFSLDVHGFPPLPVDQPSDRILVAM